MERRRGFGVLLIGSLGGIAGSCVGGTTPLRAPSPIADPFVTTDAPVLASLPAGAFLVPPDPAGLDDEILSSKMLRDPEFRAEVDTWIEFWRTRASRWFPDYLERMTWFEETVDSTLLANGLPLSLRYLPVIESGYSPVSYTHLRAHATVLDIV